MKRCEVISYNKYREVVVFIYEETEIQMHYHLDSVPEFIYVVKNGDALTGFVKVLDVLTQNPLVTAGMAGAGIGAFKFFKDLDELRNHRVSTMNFPILTFPIVGLADIRNIA